MQQRLAHRNGISRQEREREREYLRDLLRDLLKMSRVLKAESLLRLLCLVLASLFAVLVGFDTQTETVFFVRRKATVKDLEVLWISTIIASVAAGYHLLQLCRCLAFVWLARTPSWGNKSAAWASFLLDQGVTYVMFGGIMAAMQASLMAVTGMRALQWGKLCNIYTRFCNQVAAGLICGVAASLAMAVVSSVSAHHLFRLYPTSDPCSLLSGRFRRGTPF